MDWSGLRKHLDACGEAIRVVSQGMARQRDAEYLQTSIDEISDAIEDLNSPHLKQLSADVDLLIAVVGSFSSGKSTFLNYILGERLCPTETDVTTKQNTLFKYGRELKITDARGKVWSLSDYRDKVRETDLRKTDENGAHFIIEKPLDILKKWRFLDTPGRMATNDDNERCIDDDKKSEDACRKADCIIYLLGDEFSGGEGDDGDQGFLKKDCFYDVEAKSGKHVIFVRSLMDHEEDEITRQKKLRKIKEELRAIEDELGERSPHFIGPLPCGWLRGMDDRAKTTMGAILEELENLHHETRNDVRRINKNRRGKYIRKVNKCVEYISALEDHASCEKELVEIELNKIGNKYSEDKASKIADDLLDQFARNVRSIGARAEEFVSVYEIDQGIIEPNDYYPSFCESKIETAFWSGLKTNHAKCVAQLIRAGIAKCADGAADEYFKAIAKVINELFRAELRSLKDESFENRWGLGAEDRAKEDGENFLSTWSANLGCYLKDKDFKKSIVPYVKKILSVCRKKIHIESLELRVESWEKLIVQLDSILKTLKEEQ